MINPGGTANPARVSRARFIPLPPAFSRVASEELKGRIVIRLLLHKTWRNPLTDSQKKPVRNLFQPQYIKYRSNSHPEKSKNVALCILMKKYWILRESC